MSPSSRTGSSSAAQKTSDGSTRRKSLGSGPILQAALASFREVGYGGTSVRDIARGADVTVAALYHHFESKHAVLFTIMRRAMEENLSDVHRALRAAGPTATERLSAIVNAHVSYHTAHPMEAFVGNSELRSLEPEAKKVIIALRDEQEKLFHEVILDGCEDDEFTIVYTKQAARSILAMSTAVATWYRPGGDLSVKDVRLQYVDLALNLVGCRRPH